MPFKTIVKLKERSEIDYKSTGNIAHKIWFLRINDHDQRYPVRIIEIDVEDKNPRGILPGN